MRIYIFGTVYVMNNAQLVTELIEQGVLKTPRIIDAMRRIDRRNFVRSEADSAAYHNVPLPIGHNQTISQPYTVAFMLELLDAKEGMTILDIGSGSGWQTALLANIVGPHGKVTALEVIPDLAEWGKQNVEKYNFIQKGVVDMFCTSGIDGYTKAAPYDRMIAAAAGRFVPNAWRNQLKDDGLMVVPIGFSIISLSRHYNETWEQREYPGFAFVPLVAS